MGEATAGSSFDWHVYADATCAGLTALIPLPLVDLLFEAYFRRRMPEAIARVRGSEIERLTSLRLGRSARDGLSLGGCLMVPIAALRYILKKFWRKIVYVFAIADATAQVSEYWHRAYLIDHMVKAGHLGHGVDTDRAVAVFSRVMAEADTSPLWGLARQVASGGPRLLRLLVRARRRGSVEETKSLAEILRPHWGAAEASLRATAVAYNRSYTSWPDEAPGTSQRADADRVDGS
jgi:hypothetical protein